MRDRCLLSIGGCAGVIVILAAVLIALLDLGERMPSRVGPWSVRKDV